ncbi:putative P-loop containing nucleoside triphosphate hydrolase, leucine-rich repeat domain superfamily [Helianthus anomalus]
MKHVMSLLKLESGSVHMLGICGMGGIGKTTIAKAVFDQVSTCFEGSCFVENNGEVSKSHGLKHIPREVMSSLLKDEELHVSNYEGVDHKHLLVRRKVLLVLDDVDDVSQLETLVGSGKWFGEGSRIIVTTRDEQLLVTHNIMHTYYVKPLNDNESYQFLRRHAFKKDDYTKAYEDLFPQVVSYAAGLPLALKVLSSLICGRSKKEWTSTLARLQVYPEKEIQETLKKSYDSLDAAEKEVFLDIACFFIDKKKDYAVNVLNSCGFPVEKLLQSLEQKSLLSISKGEIKMHKLIVQMGRDSAMHSDEPGKRSRLWHAEEVYDILIDNMGTEEIDAIVVDDMPDYDAVDMTQAFKGMKKLRLLQIHSHNKIIFQEGSSYLPRSLRWLTWENYPLPSLPTSLQGSELVGLELHGSNISEPCSGIESLWSLRFLDLSYSMKLIKTPDFTQTPHLKELKLEYCASLIEVHESIGFLDRLSLVSFRSCTTLEKLPHSFWKLKSVTSLDVAGCLKLKVPKFMDHQLQFQSDSQMIKVPDSIGFLSNLVELDLSYLSLTPLVSDIIVRLPSLYSLKLGTVQHSSSPEPTTSLEMVECKKQISFVHDTPVDIVQRSSSPEPETSQEMID